MTPEEQWDRFIDHLNKVEPLGKDDATKHTNFLGSIAKYKKIFLDANELFPTTDQSS